MVMVNSVVLKFLLFYVLVFLFASLIVYVMHCVVCCLMLVFDLWWVICCFVAGCGGFGFGLLIVGLFIVVAFGLVVGIALFVVCLIVVLLFETWWFEYCLGVFIVACSWCGLTCWFLLLLWFAACDV